jgi:hypothetical protein
MRLEGLDKLKISIYLIETRTRDLPACSLVHQPTTLPLVPQYHNKKILKTPWSESASELYRPSDRRLLAK